MLSQHGFLSFWICFLIRSQLVCVVSISISCISDLILTCSRIQKKGISATFQIFSKKKKVPKNQHFFIYYPYFLDINTTHSTCHDTFDLMSNGGIAVKSVLGKQSNVGFCAWEEVSLAIFEFSHEMSQIIFFHFDIFIIPQNTKLVNLYFCLICSISPYPLK